jgi:hypothetical protein
MAGKISGNIWRKKKAGTYGVKKEREYMARKRWREQMVQKNSGKKARENLYQL